MLVFALCLLCVLFLLWPTYRKLQLCVFPGKKGLNQACWEMNMCFQGSQRKGERVWDIDTWTIKSLVQSFSSPCSKDQHKDNMKSEPMLKFYWLTKAQLQIFLVWADCCTALTPSLPLTSVKLSNQPSLFGGTVTRFSIEVVYHTVINHCMAIMGMQ